MSAESEKQDMVSPLADMPPVAWSPEKDTAYSLAREAITKAIGFYTGMIVQEESKPAPDTEKITEWRAARAEAIEAKRGLNVDDVDALDAAYQQHRDLVANLEGEGR